MLNFWIPAHFRLYTRTMHILGNLTLRQTQEDTNQENAFMIEELFARRIAETPNIQTTSDPLDSIRRIMQGLNCYLVSAQFYQVIISS